jgi:aminoglycoside phosphotransferase
VNGPPDPSDPSALLTGPDADDVLRTVVSTAGGLLEACRPGRVDHRAGRATVTYRARVRWPDGVRDEVLAASVGHPTDGRAPGVLVLSDGTRDVAVWLVPHDPGLPAMAAAHHPGAVRDLLTGLGLTPATTRPQDLRLLRRAYRPRRRAVVEARFPGTDGVLRVVFLKVTPPAEVNGLHDRHRLMNDGGAPVPQSFGFTADGLLVLQALPGAPLREPLRAAGPAAVPVEDLVAALDALPAGLLALPRRPAWAEQAASYAAQVGRVLPAEAGRAADLACAVEAALADGDEPVVPTHGDFYETQVLVEGGRLSGLVDVDTAGPGRRGDDLACLLAHLSVLRLRGPADDARLGATVAAWLPVLERCPGVDPVRLRARTAGVLLSLATGPYRVRQTGWQAGTSRRLDLVGAWLAAAEKPLTTVSRVSSGHGRR